MTKAIEDPLVQVRRLLDQEDEPQLRVPPAPIVQEAPTRVRNRPIVKSVLQRVAKETMNGRAIAEHTRSKVKQAAVNQYLNKAICHKSRK